MAVISVFAPDERGARTSKLAFTASERGRQPSATTNPTLDQIPPFQAHLLFFFSPPTHCEASLHRPLVTGAGRLSDEMSPAGGMEGAAVRGGRAISHTDGVDDFGVPTTTPLAPLPHILQQGRGPSHPPKTRAQPYEAFNGGHVRPGMGAAFGLSLARPTTQVISD